MPISDIIERLVQRHRFKLVIDPSPQERHDILGSAQPRVQCAQLCQGRVIAVQAINPDAIYCISHEMAHGNRGFLEEKEVLLEQASILADWVRQMLKELEKQGVVLT